MELVWQILSGLCGLTVAGLVALKVYVESIKGRCTSKVDLTGKTAIVTGANTGIGFYTAMDLARRNARVILACRDVRKGEQASIKITMETGNMNIVVMQVDLSLMKSVRSFVKKFLEQETQLDILINNAGVAGLPLTMTEEGFEMMYAANHFGPFLLTNLLLDLMKQSAPSRIVNVSSVAHKWGKGIAFDNMRAEKGYSISDTYFSSKTANILFSRELARRLDGTGVITQCLHPGPVNTELLHTAFPFYLKPFHPVIACFLKTAEEGAQTSIYCAVSAECEGVSGKYYVDCKEADNQSTDYTRDEGVAKKLWEISEKYTGLAE